MYTSKEKIRVSKISFASENLTFQKMSLVDHRLIDNAKKVTNKVTSVWTDFKSFVNRGSIIDVAVGLVLANAFGSVVNSFVDNILSPFIGLIASKNLNNAYIPIKCPDNSTVSCSDILLVTRTYPTIEAAQAVGIVTWNYGKFIQEFINFIIKGIVLFISIKAFTAASSRRKKEKAATERECLYCCSMIPIKASKCQFCGSNIDKTDY